MAYLALKQNAYDLLRKSRTLRRVAREGLATYRLLRNKAKAIYAGGLSMPAARSYWQSIPTFEAPLTDVADDQALIDACSKARLKMSFGRHAVYLPPQDALPSVLGEVVDHFPPDAGFKILRRFKSPTDATYICDPEIRRVSSWMLGPVTNQALAAGGLHAFGLGPACYGVVHLKCGNTDMTVFVVQHVSGDPATAGVTAVFRNRLAELVARGVFAVVPARGLENGDFLPPSCNGNLLIDEETGAGQYVDFQQVMLNQKVALGVIAEEATGDLHFGGSSRIFRSGKKYLYQSIPVLAQSAKRDCSYRWRAYERLLAEHHIGINSRVVLDICCNSGIMMSQALLSGAKWCVGWDLPNVTAHTRRILDALGAGRSTLVPAQLNPDYELAATVPHWLRASLEQSVVLYLSAIEHVGIIRDLKSVPWSAMLFEGHQGVDASAEERQLQDIQETLGCRLAARKKLSDGDCGRRTVALLLRHTP